jgi:hypothetical protein
MQSNNYTESNESNEVNTDNENTNTNSGAPQFSMPSASFGAPPPTNTLPAVFRFAPTNTLPAGTAGIPFGVKPTDAAAAAGTAASAGMSFGGKPNVTMTSATMASVPGGFGFGPAQHTQHTQRTSTGGCCNPFPFGNPQRHPETGQTMPQQTSVFGFRTDKTSNTPRDKLVDELYSELRNLREHVDTSNKIIGNMYELLRKI